jgi:hypothetical protein
MGIRAWYPCHRPCRALYDHPSKRRGSGPLERAQFFTDGARNFADWVVQTENTNKTLGHEVCEPNSRDLVVWRSSNQRARLTAIISFE